MTKTQLSVQLYSVFAEFSADPEGTLQRLQAMGLRNVEGVGITENTAGLKALLESTGLHVPTAHSNFLSDEIRFGEHVIEVPPFEASLDAAAELGVEILIDPMVAPERWASKDEIAKTAELMNGLSAKAAERGIRLGYHNHSMEFHHSFDGQFALEYFASLLDPTVVLEVDVFWAATGKASVPELLRGLGDRVRALHVKDGIIGADPLSSEFMGQMDLLDQRIAGQGDLDFVAILDAAPQAEYAVIEFDSFAGDIFEGVEGGVRFFNEMDVR